MATDYNAKFSVSSATTLDQLETAVNLLGAVAEQEKAMIGVLESVQKVWTDASTAVTGAAQDLRRNATDLTQSWNKQMSDASVFTTKTEGSAKSLTDGSDQMAGASGVTNKLKGLSDYVAGTGVQVAKAKTEALRQIAFARQYGSNTANMEGANMSADEIANQYVPQIIPFVLPMGNALHLLGTMYEQYGPEITAQAQQLRWVGPGNNAPSPGGANPGGAAPGGAQPGGAQPGGAQPGGDPGGAEAGAGDEAGAGGDQAGAGGDQAGAGDTGAGAGDPGAAGDLGQGDLGQGGLPPLPGDPNGPGTGLAGLPPLTAPPNPSLNLPPLQTHPGPYPTAPVGGPPPLIPPTGPLGIGPGSKGNLPSLGGGGKGGGGLGSLGGGGLGKGRGLPDLSKIGDPALRGDQQIARAVQQVSAPTQPSTGQAPAAPTGLAGSPSGTSPAGSGGMPPPMMPPGAGAAGGGGRGGKPGAGAIRPVNRKRKSQDDETPGVPIGLRGKAGKSLPGGFPMVPAASRRRKDEREKADTIQLLDEELWKVEEAEAAETKKRTGRLAT
ncbi:hypothetical protein OHA70_16030 [Kribbella sp. NBC_00382]|uniref:hypothetical protein n=1 Tax=Kribbella sp. NBC_00382 TaxID=2975967 RepID=UPI002E1C6BB0